jgi:hypothetical protein
MGSRAIGCDRALHAAACALHGAPAPPQSERVQRACAPAPPQIYIPWNRLPAKRLPTLPRQVRRDCARASPRCSHAHTSAPTPSCTHARTRTPPLRMHMSAHTHTHSLMHQAEAQKREEAKAKKAAKNAADAAEDAEREEAIKKTLADMGLPSRPPRRRRTRSGRER